MTKGESAFGFKAYAGGQGLRKWDKGMQTVLEANAHPAALAIYEGDLKSPTAVEEAKAHAGPTHRQSAAMSSLSLSSNET